MTLSAMTHGTSVLPESLPQAVADEVAALARQLSYGWGVIPVEATIADPLFTTSLSPATAST